MKIKINQVTVEFSMPDQFEGETKLSFTYYPDKPPSSRLHSYDKHDYSLMELQKMSEFLDIVAKAGSEIHQVIDRLVGK